MNVDYKKNVENFEKNLLKTKRYQYEMGIQIYQGLMNKKAPKEVLDRVVAKLNKCQALIDKLEMALAK
jgi:hypothetical protein